MDVLFRMDISEGDIEETKEFFRHVLTSRDNDFFYATVKIGNNLKSEDTIYFAYDSYIVAKAIFCGERNTCKERDNKYTEGHKVENIKVIHLLDRLNNEFFRGQSGHLFIDENQKKDEIKRVLEKAIYDNNKPVYYENNT